MEQGSEDQVAQINYIIDTTGKESLSYVGYSMGTMQFYHALATSSNNMEVAKALNKVDKFLAVTPCSYINFANKTTGEDKIQYVNDFMAMMEEHGQLFYKGEGSDR
jgi:poly(3-hydroxyalkanoate) synthetase